MDSGLKFIESYEDGKYILVEFQDEKRFISTYRAVTRTWLVASVGVPILSYVVYKKITRKYGRLAGILSSACTFLGLSLLIGSIPHLQAFHDLSTKLGSKYNHLYKLHFSGASSIITSTNPTR